LDLHSGKPPTRNSLHRRDERIALSRPPASGGPRIEVRRSLQSSSLVWFEEFADIELAIQREKSLKRYPRAWKINLIESTNLHWIDLFPSLPAYRTPTDVEHAPGLDPRHKAEDDT